MFLAHIRKSDFTPQTVEQHLLEVACLARKYGDPIGFGAHSELAGLLHDMGKFSEAFNRYLKNAVYGEDVPHRKIDHSTAGAKYLYEKYYETENPLEKFVVEIVGMAILSHHSGLLNFVQLNLSTPSDYIRRVVEKDLPYYDEVKHNFSTVKGFIERVDKLFSEAVEELERFMSKISKLENSYTYISYLQKLILSILIDADRTNARCFEENTSYTEEKGEFYHWYQTMIEGISQFSQNDSKINQLRSHLSEICDEKAEEPSNIYTLSIPTGGGKTYASLRYALKHAHKFNKKRIIYVIPYTTIIEQNADSVRDIIKSQDSVLEHHSNVMDFEDTDEDFYDNELMKKLQLGRDNWDYPIIFTTTVQFLNAFYKKGTKNTRRLHRLTDAVIIFDEVQAIPFKHFALFNTAINFLHKIGNSSILLCTATQPAIDFMDYAALVPENSEIVPNLEEIVKRFERVSIINRIEKKPWNTEQFADEVERKMEETESILIILNKKIAVRKLYQALKDKNLPNLYHLSTSMCPAHRKEVIREIKDKLEKEKVICISTQLIEAGVDISFATVFRSLAGLDSIAQAAGRCNRHGEAPEKGNVYIIKFAEENLRVLPEIRIGAEVTETFILNNEEYEKDLLSPKSIRRYFEEFINHAKREIKINPPKLNHPLIDLINGKIRTELSTLSISSFKTLERHFEAIESNTTSVLVPYGKRGKSLIAQLNEELPLDELNQKLKESQQFIVNVFDYELKRLVDQELIYPLFNKHLYVVRSEAYSEKYGLSLEGKGEQEFYSY